MLYNMDHVYNRAQQYHFDNNFALEVRIRKNRKWHTHAFQNFSINFSFNLVQRNMKSFTKNGTTLTYVDAQRCDLQ